RRPAGEARQGDELAAPRARFAGLTVDAELALVAALQAGAANVIADAGAALGDGPLQHGDDCLAQPLRLAGVELTTEPRRRQLRLKERFIRVNVAHAGHDALVQ